MKAVFGSDIAETVTHHNCEQVKLVRCEDRDSGEWITFYRASVLDAYVCGTVDFYYAYPLYKLVYMGKETFDDEA